MTSALVLHEEDAGILLIFVILLTFVVFNSLGAYEKIPAISSFNWSRPYLWTYRYLISTLAGKVTN